MKRELVLLAAVLSAGLLVLALVEVKNAPPVLPVDVPLVEIEESRTVPPRWVRLTGGRAILPVAALELSAPSVPARVFLPLRSEPLPETRAARVVVASRDAELLSFFSPDRPKDLELDPLRSPDGELLPISDATPDETRQIAKLAGSVDPDGWLLREGVPPRPSRAYPYGFAGALGLLLAGLASRRESAKGDAAPPRAARSRPAPSAPVRAGTDSAGAPRSESSPVAPSGPVALPPLPEPVRSAAPFLDAAAGIVDPEEIPDPPEGPPPDAAEVRRRLLDYASIATASSDEIPRRFRFVAEKVLASPAGMRVFPVVGRPFDVEWGELSEIAAWRLPNLTPWHERVVLELVRSDGSAGARPPVRLLPTSRVDLVDLQGVAIPGAAGAMRRLARAARDNARGAAIDGTTRRWCETGAPPRPLPTLRALAERDARFPDPAGGAG